jgi:anthranilate phosphoribosyltransferase
MELKDLLDKLVRREDLTEEEANFAIRQIASEESTTNPVGLGVMLSLLAAKGESPQEVAAFAKYMREHAIQVKCEVRPSQTLSLRLPCI